MTVWNDGADKTTESANVVMSSEMETIGVR